MKRLLALGAAVGAALAYFYDPKNGSRRRSMTRDRLLAFFRRTGSQAGRAGQAAKSQAYGVTKKAVHLKEGTNDPPDDATSGGQPVPGVHDPLGLLQVGDAQSGQEERGDQVRATGAAPYPNSRAQRNRNAGRSSTRAGLIGAASSAPCSRLSVALLATIWTSARRSPRCGTTSSTLPPRRSARKSVVTCRSSSGSACWM